MPSPKTFNGALTPYATPAVFLEMADVRLLGDLVRDDGTEATPTQLLTDPNLAIALSRASGLIESAALQGERYTIDDLQSFPDGSNAQALLQGMVCGLAIQYVRRRRGYEEPDYAMYKDSREQLELLRDGHYIFPFVEVEEAGLVQTMRMFPSSFYQGMPTLLTNNYRSWGFRANRGGNFGWGNGGLGANYG
jgi:hypothetical protein